MEQEQKQKQEIQEDKIIRILAKDIEGGKTIYAGLTKVKGISWTLSNAICRILGIDKNKKIQELSKDEIAKIEKFFDNPQIPDYMKNRQKDFDSGEDKHLVGTKLELQKEFDIKRLKKIKSYRGFRHSAGLPMRGQRTKSNFRRNRRKGSGIKKKK